MFNTHASKALHKALHTLRAFALSILGLFVGLFNVIATYLKGTKAIEKIPIAPIWRAFMASTP
jgi:hypothetical protein